MTTVGFYLLEITISSILVRHNNKNIYNIKKWSVMQDSNLRPSAPKADALPDCANHRRGIFYMKHYVMSRKNLDFFIFDIIQYQYSLI